MTALDELLKDQPKVDYEWSAGHLGAPPQLPEGDIKIRLGGIFSPGYEALYTAAWRELMGKASELAIPILYLQRHALELTVKNLIRMLLFTREEMRVGYEIFGIEADAKAVDMGEWKKHWKLVHKKHEFDPLFSCLAENLSLLGLPEVPPEFHKARELIHALDPGDGTRFRYDTVGQTRERSFEDYSHDEPKIAQLGELARHLETIAGKHSRVSERGASPVSFLDELYQHSVGVNIDVGWAVHGLEEKTRKEQLVWSVARTPRVVDSTHLDSKFSLLSSCYAADHDGRRFVIVHIEGSDPYADFLACEEHGELSRLLWIVEYQSNLYFAVKDSLEKRGVQVPW